MDIRDLPDPSPGTIEDRRFDIPKYPSRAAVLMSLFKGLVGKPPPPLTHVETWNGDPNQQYTSDRYNFMDGPMNRMPWEGKPGITSLSDYAAAARPFIAKIMAKGGSLFGGGDYTPQQRINQSFGALPTSGGPSFDETGFAGFMPPPMPRPRPEAAAGYYGGSPETNPNLRPMGQPDNSNLIQRFMTALLTGQGSNATGPSRNSEPTY